MVRVTNTQSGHTDATDSDTKMNSIEASAERHVSAAEADEEGAINAEEPLLCPCVCLGYAAGAFVVGYGATKNVGSSADTAEDGSALTAFLNETEVSSDASVEELIEMRERA